MGKYLKYLGLAMAIITDAMAKLADGILTPAEIVDGLENAPEAFLRLFKGANFGKLIVEVS